MKIIISLSIFLLVIFSANAQTECELRGEAWEISNGNVVPKGNPNDSIAIKYWKYLNNKLPSDILNTYIFSLRLFTDGKDDELGGMSSMNYSISKWEVDIDTIDFNFNNRNSLYIQRYTHTIVHEFGHLLTLNPKQIEITEDLFQNDEKGYLCSEGYANQKSYLGIFVNLFWHDELLRKWDKIDNILNENRKLNLLYKLYLKNEDQFLSDYAAESPEEDIAESWTFFVLSDKPIPDKIKHDKVMFFYKFPELVAYRKAIRKQLGSIPTNYIKNYQFIFEEIID